MYIIKKRNNPKKLIFFIIIIGLILYFAYHILQGNRGIINLFKLSKEKKAIINEINLLDKERDYLEKRISMMRSDAIDLDLLDEQVKKNLGYMNRDEEAYTYEGNKD